MSRSREEIREVARECGLQADVVPARMPQAYRADYNTFWWRCQRMNERIKERVQ